MTKAAVIEFVIENAAIGGLYALGIACLYSIIRISRSLRKKAALMVETKWVFKFWIWHREFNIPESAQIQQLQEENAVLKMEIAALKSTKRTLSIILAAVGAVIIFIAFGKQIIDFVAQLFKQSSKSTSLSSEGADDTALSESKEEKSNA